MIYTVEIAVQVLIPARSRLAGPLGIASLLTVGLRIFYSAAAALAAPHLELDPRLIHSNALTGHLVDRSEGLRYLLWGVWERFDTLWYLHIGAHGYDRPDAVVFYPLYALLVRLATAVVREPLAGALLVSTAAAWFLFWGYQKLLLLDLPPDAARRAVILYAAWPAAFVLFAGYPESLLAALIVWSIYFARTGHWWWAGIAGCAAGLAKAAGVIVAVPLYVIARRAKKQQPAPAVLCLAGPAVFAVFLKISAAALPLDAYRKYWRTETVFPWETLLESLMRVFTAPDLLLILNLIMLLAAGALVLARRVRPEYTAYALAILCLFLVKRTDPLLQSTMRYVLAVFPVYASLALLLRNRRAFAAAVSVLFLFNLALMGCFLEWALLV